MIEYLGAVALFATALFSCKPGSILLLVREDFECTNF